MHCCLFDRTCWREWWLYGAPMRLHWGTTDDPHWIAVFPSRLISWWRWHDAKPVTLEFPDHLWFVRTSETAPTRTWACEDRTDRGPFTRVHCTTCGVLEPPN